MTWGSRHGTRVLTHPQIMMVMLWCRIVERCRKHMVWKWPWPWVSLAGSGCSQRCVVRGENWLILVVPSRDLQKEPYGMVPVCGFIRTSHAFWIFLGVVSYGEISKWRIYWSWVPTKIALGKPIIFQQPILLDHHPFGRWVKNSNGSHGCSNGPSCWDQSS